MNVYHDPKYLELIKYIHKTGKRKPNRTGVDTIGVFSYQMRFDLSDGTIPLLTTKKVHTKSIIHELLWMLSGTEDVKYLETHQVSIWDEWKNHKSQLGPVYGAMWRAYPPPPTFSPTPVRNITDETTVRSWTEATCKFPLTTGKYSGSEFTNVQNLQYKVLGVDGFQQNGKNNKHQTTTYAVQFKQSGWIKYGVSTRLITSGRFVDQSLPSIYNVGILGDYQNKKETQQNKHLRRIWELMISRCYNSNDISFETHGNQGVTVCNRWKVLSDFLKDVKLLPNWFVKQQKQNYVLDKDYYGTSKLYHAQTCVWIPRHHNNLYRKDAIPIVLSSTTDTLFFPCENTAAKFVGTTAVAIKSRRLGKVRTPINGFEVQRFTNRNFVVRYPNTVDQISIIVWKLKNNPTDRRLVISGWHPGLLPYDGISPSENASLGRQALPPCHYTFQFYTRPLSMAERITETTRRYGYNELAKLPLNEIGIPQYELSLMVNQRSCDVGLGVPFNIVQYSFLLRMFAEVANMVPGEMIWNGGDTHIYENHVDALSGQILRTPFPSPTFKFARKITDIDDFKYDDFIIEDYVHHPAIKMEVAV